MKKTITFALCVGLALCYSFAPLLGQTDIAAQAILSPTTTDCYPSLETVLVEIKNTGSSPIDFASTPASVRLATSLPAVYDTVLASGLLPAGAVKAFVLTDSADFSLPGLYTLALSIALTGDTNASNDTLRTSLISLPLVSTPAIENFDSFINDGNFVGNGTGLANGFLNSPLGPSTAFNWSVREGMTGSASTGPEGDHTTGQGAYLYTESSLGSVGDTALLFSPCLDLTSTSNPGLRFYYHRYGAGMGRLEVDILTAGSQVPVFQISSQQQNSGTAPWIEQIINLAAFSGDTIQVLFRAIKGNSSTGDMALDDLEIVELPRRDLAISNLESPQKLQCVGSRNIAIEIENRGLDTLDFSITPVTLGIDIIGVNPGTYSQIVRTAQLAPNERLKIFFPSAHSFMNAGTDEFLITSSIVNDGNDRNDALITQVKTLAIEGPPYFEDFDTFVENNGDTGDGSGLEDDWTNIPLAPSTSFNWSVRKGSTGTRDTGPLEDKGSGLGSYLYTEASWGLPGDSALLISPCIDLSSLSFPQLRFFYHMFGNDIGMLEVYVLAREVRTLVFAKAGAQQLSAADPFIEFQADLSAFAGDTIQLVFKGSRGSGIEGDMAVDEVRVFEPLAFDPAISAVISPSEYVCTQANASLDVEICNEGREDIDFSTTNITLTVTLSGANTGTYVKTLLSDNLPLDSSLLVRVSSIADFSQVGITEIEVILSALGQAAQANDTLRTLVEVIPIFPGPFEEDFESFLDDTGPIGTGMGFLNGWTNDPSGPNQAFNWSIRKGQTGTSLTGPEVDVTLGTSTGTYLYTESSNFGDSTSLLSPCIDISTLTHPALQFGYHMYGTNMGTLKAYVLSHGKEELLASFSGQQQNASGDSWKEAFYLLPTNLGDTIQVKFVGIQPNASGSLSSDIAIDEVKMLDVPSRDLALVSISPNENICLNAQTPVQARIKNLGQSDWDFSLDSIQVVLKTSGAISQTLTQKVAVGKLAFTEEISIELSADFSLLGAYDVELVLQELRGDGNQRNDTLSVQINTVPTISSFPYLEDFESGSGNWTVDGRNASWGLGLPMGTTIDTAASGQHAWVTNLSGAYASEENSYVQSPCFDLSQVQGAWVFLKIWVESEFSWDGAVLQSSIDVGKSWQNVGLVGRGINWYNDTTIAGNPGGQRIGWTGRGNTGSGGWLQAGYPLSDSLSGQAGVIFRVAFGADRSEEDEGFAFDDFAIGVAPVVDLGVDDTLCIGSALVLDAGPGISYLWSNGDTTRTLSFQTITEPFPDSLFSVLVTNEFGLIGTDTILISIADTIPVASFDVQILGGTASFSNTSSGDFSNYLWRFGDGDSSTELSPNHFYPVNGEYIVSLYASNACGESQVQDTLRITATSVEEEILTGLSVYPNPSQGIFEVELEGLQLEDVIFRVFTYTGELIFEKEAGTIRSTYKTQIALPETLVHGIYFLQIHASHGTIYHRIEVKE